MMIRFQKEHILLACITTLFVVANIVWIALDQSPSLWDIAGHSQRAMLYTQHISQGDFLTLLRFDTIYPPFSYVVTGVGFLLAGNLADVPQYSLLVWIILLAISLFHLTKDLYHHNAAALLSVVVVFCYPLLAHFSRIYDLDFQQAALVTAAIAALLKTRAFHDRRWTIVFGILTAFAILTKWTSLIFLITPVLLILANAWRQQKFDRRLFLNSCIAALPVVVIAGPWYWLHGSTVLESAHLTRNNVFSVPFEDLWSVDNALFYVRQLLRTANVLLVIPAAIGLIIALVRRSRTDAFVLLSIVVPYILLSFVLYSKESRYLLSVYPFIAMLTILPLTIWTSRKRVAWIAVVVVLHVIVWTDTSWGTRLFPAPVYATSFMRSAYGYQMIQANDPKYGFTTPTQYHTEIAKIPDAILRDLQMRDDVPETIRVLVVPNSIFLTAQQIQYYSRLSGFDAPTNAWRVDYALSSQIRVSDWKLLFPKADYVITKTGDQGPDVWAAALRPIAEEESRGSESEVFAQFELLGTWTLNGIEKTPQQARLYRRK